MILFENVSLELDGKNIINNFSDNIYVGEHVCLMGKSGSGKSTLLKSILGFVVPAEGKIEVNGLEVNPKNIGQIRAQLSWVPQDVNLPYDSVSELMKAIFELKVNKHLEFDIYKMFGLFDVVGLDHQIYNKPMVEISGGEKQRVMLILALLLQRNIILLDEPTSALDTESKHQIAKLLKTFADTTILAISHDEEFAQSFDRKIIITKR